MHRFCYRSQVLPGKVQAVRDHWSTKPKTAERQHQEIVFWQHLKMTGFNSWLQQTPAGDFLIHCLEGESLPQIFKGLRETIAASDPVALGLQHFYLDVLGKDYASPATEPNIELLMDIAISTASPTSVKRGFFFPLLPHKEHEHRRFRRDAMGSEKHRHKASMEAFGVSHLSCWLQNTFQGKVIVVYSEAQESLASTQSGRNSDAWKEISAILREHTGLTQEQLNPDVEWLTKRQGGTPLISKN